MAKVKFVYHKARCDRQHYINEDDVRVVLQRLPPELWKSLRTVHFNDRSWGARIAGYANRTTDIAICALPPGISLTKFLVRGQSPEQFGAQRGRKWPVLAIRRFLLYDVLLHELGHLRIVNESATRIRRKFASEKLAQEFSDYWRWELWSSPFYHADLVHNPPPGLKLTTHATALITKP